MIEKTEDRNGDLFSVEAALIEITQRLSRIEEILDRPNKIDKFIRENPLSEAAILRDFNDRQPEH